MFSCNLVTIRNLGISANHQLWDPFDCLLRSFQGDEPGASMPPMVSCLCLKNLPSHPNVSPTIHLIVSPKQNPYPHAFVYFSQTKAGRIYSPNSPQQLTWACLA